MNDKERTKYAIEKAKESAKNLFKEKPETIKKETFFGNSQNLAKPDKKDE